MNPDLGEMSFKVQSLSEFEYDYTHYKVGKKKLP